MTALIIIAVIVVLLAAVLSVSATFTITYTDKWQTKISVLWIEKEIKLTKILDFVLFPQNKAEQVKAKKDKKSKEAVKDTEKEKKPNYLKNLWDTEGIAGIMDMAANMIDTAGAAISTLIKGFHIYSLYVKIIVGGEDADEIARAYGNVCRFYYPFKGAVLGGMKVDHYDDLVIPDFIAPRNEYGLQFIGSVSVGLLLRTLLSAGKIFVVNLIKNK